MAPHFRDALKAASSGFHNFVPKNLEVTKSLNNISQNVAQKVG
jgi:predicted RNase H-like nuclease (RuvC/YqgF family)